MISRFGPDDLRSALLFGPKLAVFDLALDITDGAIDQVALGQDAPCASVMVPLGAFQCVSDGAELADHRCCVVAERCLEAPESVLKVGEGGVLDRGYASTLAILRISPLIIRGRPLVPLPFVW